MVTLTKEELESEKARVLAEKNKISQYKKEALDITSIPIPERRFGSKITKANQDQYIKRKLEAQNYLNDLDAKDKELDNYLRDLNNAWENRKAGTRGYGSGTYKDKTKTKEEMDNTVGGYYIDTKTGYGYSSPYDLTAKKGYKRILSSGRIKKGDYIVWDKPKPEFNDTGKSYSPEVIDLGKGLVIKIPEQKQVWKPAKFKDIDWNARADFGGKVMPQTYLAQRYISFSDYLGNKVVNNKVVPLTDKAKVFLNQYNPKGYGKIPFTEARVLPSTFDVTAVAKAGLFYPATMTTTESISALTPKNLAKTKTTFEAEVKTTGKFSEISLISATEIGGRNVLWNGKVLRIPDEVNISIGKSKIKDIGNNEAIGGSGLYSINSNRLDIDALNIKRLQALSEIKDLGKAKYTNSNTQYKFIRQVGEGQVSKSIYKQTGGIEIKNLLDLTKSSRRTVIKKVKFSNDIEEGKVIAGFYKPVNEGTFKYYGYTNPLAKINRVTGRRSLILRDINIKGTIRSTDITKDITTGGNVLGKISKSKALPKVVQNEITKQVSASISSITKPIIDKSINNQIIKTTAVKSTGVRMKQSIYYGTGQYEKTDSFASLITPMTRTQTKTRFNVMQISNTNTGQKTRLRELTSQIPKVSQISINRLETRQAQRFKAGTITKQDTTIKNPKISINNFNTGRGKKFTFILFKSRGKDTPLLKKTIGYRAFSLKNGNKKYLTGVVSKGTAIRSGERFALLNKGRDIFGISKTGIKITSTNDNYLPSTRKFKSLPLKNIWVERGIKI